MCWPRSTRSSTTTSSGGPPRITATISLDAIFGQANTDIDFTLPGDAPARRGLASPDVLHALWDIFFYRDYTRYGELFGKDLRLSSWPLRHGLRVYIRNEVKAGILGLWGWGRQCPSGTVCDPYAENELALNLDLTLTGSVEAGSFCNAHNMTVAPNAQ